MAPDTLGKLAARKWAIEVFIDRPAAALAWGDWFTRSTYCHCLSKGLKD